MPARATRPLVFAWLALGVFILAARPFAIELDGQYRGTFVAIRPFMRTYNAVILSAQLVVLAFALVAALRSSAQLALVLLAAALVGTVAFLLAPILVGNGPYAPGDLQLAVYRALVFAPCVLRDLGLAALALPFVSALVRPLLFALALADAAIIVQRWHTTRIEVVATLHPSTIIWPLLLPLSALALVAIVSAQRATR